jgi:hypothetical protein
MSVNDYRAGYEAGYMYGRIDAIKSESYDERTPLQRRDDSEVSASDSESRSGAT